MERKEVPQEVVMEILSWLPIKPLLRFKCVSKTWLQLLTSDPHFINLHTQRFSKVNDNNNTNPGIVVLRLENSDFYFSPDYAQHDYNDEDKVIKLEPPFDKSAFVLFGICNGLLCVSNGIDDKFSKVYIWNPLVGDHITLPSSTIQSHIPEHGTTFGFGFHQGTNEYKVIRLCSISDSPTLESEFLSHVSVYTLGTESWRTLDDVPYHIGLDKTMVGRANGALHWFAKKLGTGVIVSFDIKDEVFREIPGPNGVSYDQYEVSVGDLGGFLSLCTYHDKLIQIWVMSENGSWTYKYKFGRRKILSVFGLFSVLDLLYVSKEGEVIVKKNYRDVILHNPNTKSRGEINQFGFPFYCALMYKGSLISPKCYHWSLADS
ncbi:hypothetical protein ACHQM5_021017 [Ranunculus cassubicifolius]